MASEHPLALIVSVISGVFGGALLFAFVMQWNRSSVDQTTCDLAKAERETRPNEPRPRFRSARNLFAKKAPRG